MAEKDTSRRTVEQVGLTIQKLTASFKSRFPYGPRNVGMTQMEERKQVQDMPLGAKLQKMNSMGPEAWDEYMKELYRKNGNN
jgi:hypothetical protein|tara:strand:+ start:2452 stop:2697 length:246 start_codon:yes stop_codon:yes gene_type:complete